MKSDAEMNADLKQGGINWQKRYLREAQETLSLDPTEMARGLGTDFDTYKAWLEGDVPMPGVARAAIDCKIRLAHLTRNRD